MAKISEENKVIIGKCPSCKKGKLIERDGRYGFFFGCSRYPECSFTQKSPNIIDQPINENFTIKDGHIVQPESQ